MNRRPLILVAPCYSSDGAEFSDDSISLSNHYTDAIIRAGGLPQVFPATASRAIISEIVARSDGVLMTGGEDIDPRLYDSHLPPELAAKIGPLEPMRDQWEPPLVAEIFERRRPVLGICRGHQMINVALGGSLLADIPTQVPNSIDHRRMDKRNEPVHLVELEADSMLARIAGSRKVEVNSTHHQALGRVADPLRVVARAPDGVAEAAELKDPDRMPFFLTVQFHPERLVDREGISRQIFQSFVEACARARGDQL